MRPPTATLRFTARAAARSLLALFLVAAILSPALARAAGVDEVPQSRLDSATREALALEDAIERAQEDADALEQHIEVANFEILRQEGTLEESHSRLRDAERRFDDRLVRMYKTGVGSPLLLLVSARSLPDLWSGLMLLSRVVGDDNQAYREARAAASEAEHESTVLDDQKAQLVGLRALRDARLTELRVALARQRLVVSALSKESQELVAQRRESAKRTRAQWQASSIPIGSKIPFAPAVVEPYNDRSYLVAAYQPRRYRATGERLSAVCSWYGGFFNGRRAASGQIYNMDDLTCASRTLPFGTRIALTRGARRIIVVVTDRGPYIAGRDLDLSAAAARALGFSGVARVECEFVEVVSTTASR